MTIDHAPFKKKQAEPVFPSKGPFPLQGILTEKSWNEIDKIAHEYTARSQQQQGISKASFQYMTDHTAAVIFEDLDAADGALDGQISRSLLQHRLQLLQQRSVSPGLTEIFQHINDLAERLKDKKNPDALDTIELELKYKDYSDYQADLLFRMYDLNHDNLITNDEIEKVNRASDSQNTKKPSASR